MQLTLLFWAFLALAVIPLIPVIRYYRGRRHPTDHIPRADEIDQDGPGMYELYLKSTGDMPAEGSREEEPLIYRKRRSQDLGRRRP